MKISSCPTPGARWAAQSRSRRDADRVVRRQGCRACRLRQQRPGNAPLLAIQLHQFAARGQPGQLLEQQAPLAPAAQAEFAHQLLVSGLLAGRAGDPRHQFTIGHRLRVGYWQPGVEGAGTGEHGFTLRRVRGDFPNIGRRWHCSQAFSSQTSVVRLKIRQLGIPCEHRRRTIVFVAVRGCRSPIVRQPASSVFWIPGNCIALLHPSCEDRKGSTP